MYFATAGSLPLVLSRNFNENHPLDESVCAFCPFCAFCEFCVVLCNLIQNVKNVLQMRARDSVSLLMVG